MLSVHLWFGFSRGLGPRFPKSGGIGANRQFDDELPGMVGAVIILSESLSHFSRCCPNHRIEIYIVIRFASEGLDTNGPFLQVTRISKQGLLNGIREQNWISFAVRK
jgi:hypothetical protein